MWLEGNHVTVVDDLPCGASVRADVGSDIVEYVVGLEDASRRTGTALPVDEATESLDKLKESTTFNEVLI